MKSVYFIAHVYFTRLIKNILEILFVCPEFKPRDFPIYQTSLSIYCHLENHSVWRRPFHPSATCSLWYQQDWKFPWSHSPSHRKQ